MSSALAYAVPSAKHHGQSRRGGGFHQQKPTCRFTRLQLVAPVSDQLQLKPPHSVQAHHAEDGETGRPGEQVKNEASTIME